MELSELAKKLGVKNIIVTTINNYAYKDNYTVVISDDLVLNLTGKTFEFIPLTQNGINKRISNDAVRKIFDAIREELKDTRL